MVNRYMKNHFSYSCLSARSAIHPCQHNQPVLSRCLVEIITILDLFFSQNNIRNRAKVLKESLLPP